MRYIDAAFKVLEVAGEPLTVANITATALKEGLIPHSGKTPEATMSAALYRRVKREPFGTLRRVAEPGPVRARRGSVRFALVDPVRL